MKDVVSRLIRGWWLGVVATAIAFAGTASASPIAANVPVDFQGGQGTVSGFFQTDGSGNVSDWNLSTSEFDCNPCHLDSGFPGIDYTPGNSTSAVGFFFGDQSITFFGPGGFQLDFIVDCGGGSANCIGNAAPGSILGVSGNELGMPDFLPFRELSAAVLDVTDPPVGLSFNLVPAAVPEPSSLVLLGLPVAVGILARRRAKGSASVT